MKARFAVDSNENDFALCENAKFDAAIIDDEKLSKHFHDVGARNVPPAVKDKKELRVKLEEKMYTKEAFDRYLSSSTLPDPFS